MGCLSAPPPSTAEYDHGLTGLCLASSRNRFDVGPMRYSVRADHPNLLRMVIKSNRRIAGMDSAIKSHKRLAVL